MQLVVWPSSYTFNGNESLSATIELTGEYIHWYKLEAYSLSFKEVVTEYAAIERSLVKAWNALKGRNNEFAETNEAIPLESLQR
jgi:hypothetical protein